MAETIKEKAMRAWAQDAHVEVVTDDKPDLNGVISELYPDRFYLKGHEWRELYKYEDIQDIRFMDEPGEFPAESYDVEILWEWSPKAAYLRERIRKGELKLINDETGVGKIVNADPPVVADLKAAQVGGYRVKVDFGTCTRTGIVTQMRERGFALRDAVLAHHSYDTVLSVERAEPPDMAKERWEHINNGIYCCNSRLAKLASATPEQIRVMTEAPRMLEALENVIAMDEASAAPLSRSDLDDIVAIIKKARGEYG